MGVTGVTGVGPVMVLLRHVSLVTETAIAHFLSQDRHSMAAG